VDITDENKDELMLLCARLGIVSRLPAVLQAGANLKHTDKAGNTAVELAVEQKHEAAVEVLVQAIIVADIDMDARYKQGKTVRTGPDAGPRTLSRSRLQRRGRRHRQRLHHRQHSNGLPPLPHSTS
jgi:hypothetical protein